MIVNLSLTITLWIVWCRELMADFVLGTEGSHLSAGESYYVVDMMVCSRLR